MVTRDNYFELSIYGLKLFIKNNTRFHFNYTGSVIVGVSVDSLGNVSNPNLKKRANGCDSCNTEALRVISLIKKMNPAFQIKNKERKYFNSETKFSVPF